MHDNYDIIDIIPVPLLLPGLKLFSLLEPKYETNTKEPNLKILSPKQCKIEDNCWTHSMQQAISKIAH